MDNLSVVEMHTEVTLGPLETVVTDNVSHIDSITQFSRRLHRVPVSCHEDNMLWMRYVCNVMICLPIAVLGIVANVVSFVVLWKQKPRLTTTVLLQGLALADTAVLLVMALLYSPRYINICTGLLDEYMEGYAYVFRWLYPVAFFVRMTSTWLTVLLTIDRYIAVCHPLHAQRLCTINRAYKHMVGLVVVALLCSLPRFFEYEMESGKFKATTLLSNKYYTVGYGIIAFFVLAYLLPMLLLVILNSRLLCALYSANSYRTSLQQANTQTRANNRSITIVVITIVVMCIISDSTGMLSHIMYVIKVCFQDLQDVEVYRRYLSNIRNVIISINSAGNFVIYCLCSRNFRLALKSTFSCKERGSCLKRSKKKRTASTARTYYSSLSKSSSTQ